MRYAGWFDHASAVLVGRTLAPDSDGMTQHDAVRDALGDLDVPVVLDVECGHVAPFLPLVNGARGPRRHRRRAPRDHPGPRPLTVSLAGGNGDRRRSR